MTIMAVRVIEILKTDRAARWWLFLALGLFVASAAVNFLGVFDRLREPYIIHASRLLTPPAEIRADGDIDIEYDIDRRRLCRTELISFFKERPSNSVVARKVEIGGTTGLGQHTIKNKVKLPDQVKSGQCYSFEVSISSECTSNTIFNYPAQPVEFCVQ